MDPWLQYPAGDPRADPANWVIPSGSSGYAYAGPIDPAWNTTSLGTPTPAAEPVGYSGYDPLSSAYPTPAPAPAADYNYGAAEPYGTSSYGVADEGYALQPQSVYTPAPAASSTQLHPLELPSNYDAEGNYLGPSQPGGYAGYDPLSSAYPTQAAPAYDPLTSGNAGTPPTGGYATQPVGEDFTVDAERFAEYEQYLNDFDAGLAPGVVDTAGGSAAPAVAPAIAPAAAPASAAIVPSAVYDGGGNVLYDAGGGGGYGGGAGGAATGYPAPVQLVGRNAGFDMDRSGLPGPGQPGFDPFAWSGTRNPRPAPNPMQQTILQAMGLGAQMEQERAAAEEPRLTARGYALHRLGLTQPEQPEPAPPVAALPSRSAFTEAPRLGEEPAYLLPSARPRPAQPIPRFQTFRRR